MTRTFAYRRESVFFPLQNITVLHIWSPMSDSPVAVYPRHCLLSCPAHVSSIEFSLRQLQCDKITARGRCCTHNTALYCTVLNCELCHISSLRPTASYYINFKLYRNYASTYSIDLLHHWCSLEYAEWNEWIRMRSHSVCALDFSRGDGRTCKGVWRW